MPKCDFDNVDLQLYWNLTSAWVSSDKFEAYFYNIVPIEHLWIAASGSK